MYNYNYQELFHYGMPKRSGRYPYGSGDRPYQDREGSSPKKKRVSRRERRAEKKAAKTQEKLRRQMIEQKKAEIQEQRRQAEEKARHDADKARVLREGTALELMQYRNELSNAELEAAIKRLELNKKLSGYSQKEIKTNFDKMNDFMEKAKKVNGWATTGIDTYRNVQTIMNLLDGAVKNAQKQENKQNQQKKKSG